MFENKNHIRDLYKIKWIISIN